jgi:hypothetical protein
VLYRCVQEHLETWLTHVAKAAPPGVRRRLLRVFVRRGLLDVLSCARGKEGTNRLVGCPPRLQGREDNETRGG